MKKVLVTGAHGQLGNELNFVSSLLDSHSFTFVSRQDLDISDEVAIRNLFATHKFEVFINAAAYTAVDKAEMEPEEAYAINVLGSQNLAKICKINDTVFVKGSYEYNSKEIIFKEYYYYKSRNSKLDSIKKKFLLNRAGKLYLAKVDKYESETLIYK